MKNFFAFFLIPLFTFSQNKLTTISSNTPLVLNLPDFFKNSEGIELNQDKFNKNRFTYSIELHSPNLFYFLDIVNDKMYYFFLLPGDNINIEYLPTNDFLFFGANNYEFAMINDLEKENVNILYKYDGQNTSLVDNSNKALNNSLITSLKRDSILANYKSKIRSEIFELFSTACYLKRLDFLLEPYNPTSKFPKFKPLENENQYFDEIESLIKQISKINPDKIEAYAFWLSRILVNYSNFRVREMNDSEKFNYRFNVVAQSFNGLVKDAYLTTILLNESKFNQIETEYLTRYYEICKNSVFKEKVKEATENRIRKLENQNINNTQLKNPNNLSFKWSEILNSNKGKIIYVDFWASWCVGCKVDLPKIKELKRKFPEMHIIFISKDEDETKWLSAIDSWDFSNIGEHYLVNPSSEFARIFTEPSIPRSCLINKEGKVITINSDSPNSEFLIKKIRSLNQ